MIAVLFLAACDRGSGSAAQGQDRRTFNDRADAICFAAADQLAVLGGRDEIKDPSQDAIVKFRVAVPIYRLLVAGLRQLEPPAGAGADVAALIDAFDRVAEQGETVIAAGRAGDRRAYEVAVGEYWERLDAAIDGNHAFGLSCP